jgi:DNA-binding beta-propeller fold protein YncE
VDYLLHRVQKFDSYGNFILKWGKNGGDGNAGSSPGEFSSPSAIDVDANGNIYVLDANNSQVQKFADLTIGIEASTWSSIKRLYR